MNAVVLAGEDNKKSPSIRDKASVMIKGIPMINYVLTALIESKKINRVVVVGNEMKLNSIIPPGVELINNDGDMFENFVSGAEAISSKENLLVVTCDIPLISPNTIDDFITQAIQSKADLCYPIIHKKNCEEKFCDLKRTYVTLKDGTYTGGNIIFINPNIINIIEPKAKILIKERKNPIAMTYSLGVGFLFKLLTKQLTVTELEMHLSKTFNIEAKAIVTEYPELGCDVDKDEHLEKIIKYII